MTESSAEIVTPNPKPIEHQDAILRGIVYAALAFFLLAVMNALGRYLSNDLSHHVIEVSFYRNLFAVLPLLIYILATRKFHYFTTKSPKVMALRSTIGLIGMYFTFAAFQALPMAETTVLLFSASLILPALSYFILKEHVGLYRWGAILIGLCGVILMAGPSSLSNHWGVMLALCAACMHASVGIVLRYMKTESPLTITFYFAFTGMILTGLFMPFLGTIPTKIEWGLFILTGLSGAAGQLCLAAAFKYAPASVVTSFNYTGLLWATGFDIVLWQIIPGWPVFLGGSIVIGSSLFIAYRERLNSKKEKENKNA